jgi:hypothetical protein
LQPTLASEVNGSGIWRIAANGYVYETFGISKHFPVKLQVLLIRAEKLDNPMTAKCFIYDVTAWCSVFQSCKPLSLFSFRVIFILLSSFLSACVSAFFVFLSVGKFFKTIFLGALALQAL